MRGAAGDMIKTQGWIKGGGKGGAPWDEKGFKLPGGPVYSKAGMMMFPGQRHLPPRDLRQLSRRRRIMSCVYEDCTAADRPTLRVESRYFTPDSAQQ